MQMGPDPAAACDYFRRQLKALYQRLLHGMRIEHIARTVYDSSNVSIILVKNETEVIGGAPYSPWDDWGYAEVVLMGIASTYQRRGFDGRALALLKRFVANWHPFVGLAVSVPIPDRRGAEVLQEVESDEKVVNRSLGDGVSGG
jgi:hypothetical protein